jgi:ribonuclease BN (tRNA processing enzyme)
VRITVLGGLGAFPTAGQGCSGYLVEIGTFRLLIDPGYATVAPLFARVDAARIDAVLVSHGHPDHCADLQPLLRARVLSDEDVPTLPVYAPTSALDRLLDIDELGLIDNAYRLHSFAPGDRFEVGPFRIDTWELPHFVPTAGLRLNAGDRVLAYTGDTGPSPALADLARDADLFLAEATYPTEVPARRAGNLSTAVEAGQHASAAGAARLLLTHLWPGTDPEAAVEAGRRTYHGPVDVARPGLVLDLR